MAFYKAEIQLANYWWLLLEASLT